MSLREWECKVFRFVSHALCLEPPGGAAVSDGQVACVLRRMLGLFFFLLVIQSLLRSFVHSMSPTTEYSYLTEAELVSWCFERTQPQWLHQGRTQTSVYLQVIHSTSHYTTSLYCSNHSSNSIHNFGTQNQKNNNIFLSLFIFREHSTRELASSRVTYFILLAYTGTGVSHS